jgi:predicted dehydrogenase
MTDVVLVGAGGLGSRHLQALARLPEGMRLHVVDPVEASLATARRRYEEVSAATSSRVSYRRDVKEIPRHVDVAIVATTADRRRGAIETLLDRATVGYLVLEKVLFQTVEDYPAVARLLTETSTPAWVNHTRRLWPGYRSARHLFGGARRVDFDVSGPQWDLGCNGVHFIDLIAFLVGSTEIQVDDVSLETGTLPVRRVNFQPFTGWIAGRCGPATFRIASAHTGEGPIEVNLDSDVGSLSAQETPERLSLRGRAPRPFETGEWPVPLQSQLTDGVVLDLVGQGSCSLATFEESSRAHLPMLEAFLAHLAGGRGTVAALACPIT